MAKTSEKRVLRRTAKEIKNYRILIKILPAIAALLAIIVVVVYIVTVLYNKFGSFTVMVNKYDNAEYGLTLSESRDFNTLTSRLNSKASEEITNISGSQLPQNLDTEVGGIKHHEGDDFVAYTFFLTNKSTKTYDVDYKMIIVNMTKEIEEAVRVRVYINQGADEHSYTDYARPRLDASVSGREKEPVFCDEIFYDDREVLEGKFKEYTPELVTRITVVIWLEGDDPECVDKIIGGQFKVDMSFSVSNVYEEEAA